MADEFCLKMLDFHVTFRYLLHAVDLRHGTNGFTSLPKEGVLRVFSPSKIRRLRPGLNLRTWVPQASTLPIDHRSRLPTSLLVHSIFFDRSGQNSVWEISSWCRLTISGFVEVGSVKVRVYYVSVQLGSISVKTVFTKLIDLLWVFVKIGAITSYFVVEVSEFVYALF